MAKKVPPFSERPASFVTVDNRGYTNSRNGTEILAVKAGKAECSKDDYRVTSFVGVYKLIKIIRRKEVPVEIETVEV